MLAGWRFGAMNGLLVAACVAVALGGVWPLVAYALVLVSVTLGDETAGDEARRADPAHAAFYMLMLRLTLPLMLGLFVLTMLQLGGWFGPPESVAVIGSLLLAGLFAGAAATNVAHELIHRREDSSDWVVGRWLLAFTADTSFAIEHVHGHHRTVGTLADPATARRGETLYAFLIRSTFGQIASAFRFEAARLARLGLPVWSLHNRVLRGQIMTLALAVLALLLAGLAGVGACVLIAVQGKFYLEAVNYIEHYGLVRVQGSRFEERHAWNSNRAVSGALLYNLPRHSGHHMVASKPFWTLAPEAGAPMLPFGYKTMILVALVPPLFRRLMAPRLADWDQRLASEPERAMLTAA
jgi:alkane 1-monooxygenase